MSNARRRGVRIGRPPAEVRPNVASQLAAVRAAVEAGTLSKRAAARALRVGSGTLARLLTVQKWEAPKEGIP